MTSDSDGAHLIPRSRGTIVFLTSCCVLFLICVALRLNGSSSALWFYHLNDLGSTKGLIAGTPQVPRSDEWMVWTPAVLSQLHQRPPMPVKNMSLGAGVAPLLMSVPVRHYSMFFRPQLWGFFFLDEERGFAWYWNAKAFGLLVSCFLLLAALTRGRTDLAVLGSLAISYSSFMQWWFSSPTMLPETLTSWAIVLLSGWTFFRAVSLWKKLLAIALFVAGAINFVLCCYPPCQIPFVYLALFLFAAFLWEHRRSSFHGGIFWLGAALLLVAALLWPTFQQCRSTLEIIAQTSYPGARRSTGGDLSLVQLFSGLLNFFDNAAHHADSFPNASEAANFFPIWLLAIAVLIWRLWPRRNQPRHSTVAHSNALLVAFAAFVVLFSFYALVGLPEALCRVSVLSFCTGKRVLFAVSVAGLLLTILAMRRDEPIVIRSKPRIVAMAAIFTAALCYFLRARSDNPIFLSPSRFVLLLVVTTILGASYLCLRPRFFASLFAGTLVLNNFLVNPINQGLPSLLETSAAQHIAAIYKSDPKGVWACYEHGALAQFVIASGAPVLNGVKVVPPLPLLRQFDPAGANRDIYNRFALIILGLPGPGQNASRFSTATPDSYVAYLSPREPGLRKAGLRYVVFPRPLDESQALGLQLIDALTTSRIWIYRLL